MGLSIFLQQMLPYLLLYKKQLVIITLLLLFPCVFYISVPLSVQLIFDIVIQRNNNELLWVILSVLSIGFVVTFLADLLHAYLAAKLSAQIINDMRLHLLTKIHDFSVNVVTQPPSGEISHFTNDLNR